MTWFYIAALAAAFALRSVLAIYTEGHPIDVGTFKAWAVRAATVGLGGFYSEDVFADYPPGYVYIFYLIGKIKNAISLTDASKSFLLLIKLPSMITDIAAAHIVFLMARRNFSKAAAATLALAYALNPAILVNCAVWGQVDSVFSLCVLVFITLIAQGRLNAGAAAFAVAVLVKPQGLIFTPILIFALSRVSLNNAAAAVGLAVTVFTAAILPFTINKAPLWIFKHYYTTLSSYPYASLNAFNLHALMGGNWAPVTDRVLGVTYEFWGYMFIALAVGLCAFIFYKKKDTATDTAGMYWFISTVLITSAFVVSTRMHERYLFAGLVLLLICYINIRDKRLLYLYAFVSVTFFINEAYVLYYGMKELYHIDTYDVVVEIVSAAHVGVLVYLIKLGCDIYIRKPMPAAAAVINAPPLPPTLSLAGKDYAAIAIITLFNLAVMYYGIGCSKAPETFWSSAEGQRSLWADLGRQQNLSRVCFFSGIGDGQYEIRYSRDFQYWQHAGTLKQKAVFEWQCAAMEFQGRYVLLTATSTGAMLNEIAFFDKGAQTPLPVKSIMPYGPLAALSAESNSNQAGNLTDEQHTVPTEPSYANSTYFDEVYHARTAYEYLHGLSVYETTHPPLGKVFIELGIIAFGMNPFGWRVVGALFAAFIPAIVYVFGYRLFGRTRYALIASLLMTFDFMRVAQGRMATVDTYAVFFIILMYYYMYRYWVAAAASPLNSLGIARQARLNLGCSGLFFGLGVAVKWISVYAGGGLALVFFASILRKYIEFGKMAKPSKVGKRQSRAQASAVSIRHLHMSTLRAVKYAALFFIVIPAVIYCLSYVPTAKYHGVAELLKAVVQNQKDMYDYHTNLVAEHPFSSKWYEWPIIKRPLWLYSGNPPAGQVQSIVSMGNPAVWWVAIVAVGAVLGAALFRKRADTGVFIVLTGFFAQYIPWIGVSRLTFIYHFYASVPFAIFCITYAIKWLEEGRYGLKRLTYAYLSLTAVLFVAFYPILTGIPVSKAYVSAVLRWFDSWIFYS